MSTQDNPWVEDGDIKNASWTTHTNLIKKLPDILRTLGTIALLVAMYSFLAKGWQSGNDVFRYLMMLGHTSALAIIGLASGHWLKEGKGARLLMALALVSVPANFAILGAFIFSQTAAIDISHYPNYVAWTVDSLNTALLTSGGAMLLLIPITLLGFTVLARSMSKKLSLLFLCSNAALLLPLRDPQLIGLLVLSLAFLSIFLSRKASRNKLAAKTREGVIALGLQLLPLAVLMGRSLWLYSFDLFLFTVLSITVFFVLRQTSTYLEQDSRWHGLTNVLSIIPAMAVAPLLSVTLIDVFHFAIALAFPVGALVSAALIYDISNRSATRASLYRHLAAAVLLLTMITNLMMFTSLMATLTCIVIGISVAVFGYNKQQRSVFASGFVLTLTGIGQQFYEIFHHFDLGSWASLAVLGVASIVIASTIESQGGKIKPRIDDLKNRLNEWEK